MRVCYPASLLKGGVIGGALYVEADTLTFCTNRFVLPECYRRLHLPLREITDVKPGKYWPLVTVTKADGKSYRFLVFARKRFSRRIASLMQLLPNVGNSASGKY